MKHNMVVMRLFLVPLSTALLLVSTGVQGYAAEKSQMPETVDPKAVQFIQEDITQNPLKPPDTSSPRATLKSFLDNANDAYRLAMAGHRENMETPGVFTSESVRQKGRHADQLFQRAVYCLNLQEVPDALKKSWGIEGALFLKEIFDRIPLPPFEEIPDAQAIEAKKVDRKTAGPLRWQVPDTEIVIAQVQEGPPPGRISLCSRDYPPPGCVRRESQTPSIQIGPFRISRLSQIL